MNQGLGSSMGLVWLVGVLPRMAAQCAGLCCSDSDSATRPLIRPRIACCCCAVCPPPNPRQRAGVAGQRRRGKHYWHLHHTAVAVTLSQRAGCRTLLCSAGGALIHHHRPPHHRPTDAVLHATRGEWPPRGQQPAADSLCVRACSASLCRVGDCVACPWTHL